MLLHTLRGFTIMLSVICSQIVHPKDFPLNDWLLANGNVSKPTTLLIHKERHEIELTNGLVSKRFLLKPDFVMTDFYSHEIQMSILRAVNPEAQIILDNVLFDIGGVLNGMQRAYFNRSSFINIHQNPKAFHYNSFQINKPVAPFPYKPRRGCPKDITWPPKGLRLDVTFHPPKIVSKKHQSVKVIVHHEMYDGIPMVKKWITVESLTQG